MLNVAPTISSRGDSLYVRPIHAIPKSSCYWGDSVLNGVYAPLNVVSKLTMVTAAQATSDPVQHYAAYYSLMTDDWAVYRTHKAY